jgi:drug/metabolite transporter (DMT)-like permease
MKQPAPRNLRAAGEQVTAAFLFASMSCIAHGYGSHLAWPAVAFVRIATNFSVVLLLLRLRGEPFVIFAPFELWLRSLFGSCSLLCTFYAVTHLPVTDQVTLSATGPIWVAVILAIVFRQHIPRRAWGHAVLALAGVYVMQRPTFSAESLPVFMALLAALLGAAAMVSLSRCQDLPKLTIVAHFSMVGTIITLGVCAFADGPLVLNPQLSGGLWLWLLAMGLAGTFGQIFLTAAYIHGNPSMVALIGISQIVFAAIFDLAVWGYTFDIWKVAGVAIIAIAIALSVLGNARAAVEA